jgi:trehalose-phosphatase
MPEPSDALSLVGIEAIVFDLDGVLTDTAEAHFEAWKATFDAFLEGRRGADYEPFSVEDYRVYVDGKPRFDGVESFLEARGFELDFGEPDEGPSMETIVGIGTLKNERYQAFLDEGRVEVFDDARRFVEWACERHLALAVVSSSRNCAKVLAQTDFAHRFSARVDGNDLEAHDLAGKPAPDMFVEAARRLGVLPKRAIGVEDAVSGIEAIRGAHFGRSIGMARAGNADALARAGADLVISSFDDLDTTQHGMAMKHDMAAQETTSARRVNKQPDDALEAVDEIVERVGPKTLAVFLDYDGTLTPIVEDPAAATLSESMRRAVAGLAEQTPVAVVSGRDLGDVRERVGLEDIAYAGSHGFDILAPDSTGSGADSTLDKGEAFLPALDRADDELRRRLRNIDGARIERKRYSLAVHYRQVADKDVPSVEKQVDGVLAGIDELRKTHGKKVFDLQPKIDWDKGRAVEWLLEELDLDGPDVAPMYIGDDVTDEDAFRVLAGRGVTVSVQDEPKSTAAAYRLDSPAEVQRFLDSLAGHLRGRTP